MNPVFDKDVVKLISVLPVKLHAGHGSFKMADTEMANGDTTPSNDKQQSEGTLKKEVAKVGLLQPKKYKTSELPLTQDQQTAIQSLLVAFKKKGGFDNYRKKIWADFENSVCYFARWPVSPFCARIEIFHI